ncbi:MAG: hypothetical protein QNJ37_06605 [Crocosphaera sp.]|nr:hypothetical protein [Crocosphaera sp.]
MENVLYLLKSYQTHRIVHTKRTFYEHLVGTGDLLKKWKCAPTLCLAGYFHSFYGTEGTQKNYILKFCQRKELQEAIGEEAEKIVYLFCICKQRENYFDIQPNQRSEICIINRLTSDKITISYSEWLNLVILHMANVIEEFDYVPWHHKIGIYILFYRLRYRKVFKYLSDSVKTGVQQKFTLDLAKNL